MRALAVALGVGMAGGSALLAIGVDAALAGPPAVSATVRVGASSALHVRTGPGTSYPIVGRLPGGSDVAVGCQTSGVTEVGSVRTTAVWDRLTNGSYISDAFVSFGGTRPDVPWCTVQGSAAVTSWLNRRANASTLLNPLGLVRAESGLTIACQLLGESIVGSSSATDAWDQLTDGSYVSDAFVAWPGGRPSVSWCAFAGPPVPESGTPFVAWIAPYAQASMKAYGVPASVTIAQAILESGWGRSGLTADGNAYFGMKCFGTPGPIAVGCRPFETTECAALCGPTVASFRLYASIAASFNDHGQALSTMDRYRIAMQYTGSPDRFAVELQRAGYATSPTYAANLITLMRDYNLYQYDRNLT